MHRVSHSGAAVALGKPGAHGEVLPQENSAQLHVACVASQKDSILMHIACVVSHKSIAIYKKHCRSVGNMQCVTSA